MAITTLMGNKIACRRNRGGASVVGIVPIAGIANVTFTENAVSAITFQSGVSFANYQSVIDKISVTFSGNEVAAKLRLGTMSKESSAVYNELLDACACGVAMLVKQNNGAVALLGVTEEDGLTRPLMTIEGDGNSGEAPTDENYLDVTIKTTQPTAIAYLADELAKNLDSLFTAK